MQIVEVQNAEAETPLGQVSSGFRQAQTGFGYDFPYFGYCRIADEELQLGVFFTVRVGSAAHQAQCSS